MAKISAEPEQGLIDALMLLAPSLQAPDCKGMSKIMDSGCRMITARLALYRGHKLPKNALNGPRGQGIAGWRYEKWEVRISATKSVACLIV